MRDSVFIELGKQKSGRESENMEGCMVDVGVCEWRVDIPRICNEYIWEVVLLLYGRVGLEDGKYQDYDLFG
jgi:hypothetical protein